MGLTKAQAKGLADTSLVQGVMVPIRNPQLQLMHKEELRLHLQMQYPYPSGVTDDIFQNPTTATGNITVGNGKNGMVAGAFSIGDLYFDYTFCSNLTVV